MTAIRSTRPMGLWWLALSIALGCAEGPRHVAPATCDPLADTCAAGEVCAVTDEGPRCRPRVDPPARGCSAASCPTGEACATVEGLLDCRPLCAVDEPEAHACPEGSQCVYRLAGSRFGVCPPRCAPGDDCGEGATCGLSTALSHPICVAIGPAGPGAPCAEARCAAGLACLEVPRPDAPDVFVERCERLCDPRMGNGGGCVEGRCGGVVLGVEDLGYCTEDS